MDDNDNFEAAFAAEMGVEAEAPVETPAETPVETPAEIPAETPAETDIPAETPQETVEEAANRANEEAAEQEAPQPMTAADIQAAIRADRQEVSGRMDRINSVSQDVIGKVYPEGIDKSIYDSNGQVIKTAQDIVDRGLINERTGEAFSYEEAASFMLEAGRQMEQNIADLNKWAEEVAEQNVSLLESNERVMAQWGEMLKSDPKLAEELAKEYIGTQLEFDKTGSYITKMGMTPETYYNRVLAPYKQLADAQAAQAAAAAQAEAEAKAAEQDERSNLPGQRGTTKSKANTGDENLDALLDELDKK